MVLEDLAIRSFRIATKYSSSRGEPYFTFLVKIPFTFCFFFFIPVVVDTV